MSDWFKKAAVNPLESIANALSNQIFLKLKSKVSGKIFSDKLVGSELGAASKYLLMVFVEFYQLQSPIFKISKKPFNVRGSLSVVSKGNVIKIRIDSEKLFPELKNQWSDLIFEIKNVVRHELEHVDQLSKKIISPNETATRSQSAEEHKQYLMSPSEVPAFVSGLYFKAKKEKKSFREEVNLMLSKMFPLDYQQYAQEVASAWIEYAVQRFPDIQ